MASYAVHKNLNPRTCAAVPFLLDVQSDVFSLLVTRLVVPLYRQLEAGGPPLTRLCPVLPFQGQHASCEAILEVVRNRARGLDGLIENLCAKANALL